jgi:hypothetical protein
MVRLYADPTSAIDHRLVWRLDRDENDAAVGRLFKYPRAHFHSRSFLITAPLFRQLKHLYFSDFAAQNCEIRINKVNVAIPKI